MTAPAHHLLHVNSTFIQSEQETSGNAGSLSVLMSSNSLLCRNNTPPLTPNVEIIFKKMFPLKCQRRLYKCVVPVFHLVFFGFDLLAQKGSVSLQRWLYTVMILQIRIISGGYISLLLYFGLTDYDRLVCAGCCTGDKSIKDFVMLAFWNFDWLLSDKWSPLRCMVKQGLKKMTSISCSYVFFRHKHQVTEISPLSEPIYKQMCTERIFDEQYEYVWGKIIPHQAF